MKSKSQRNCICRFGEIGWDTGEEVDGSGVIITFGIEDGIEAWGRVMWRWKVKSWRYE